LRIHKYFETIPEERQNESQHHGFDVCSSSAAIQRVGEMIVASLKVP